MAKHSRWVFLGLTIAALLILGRLYVSASFSDRSRVISLALVCGGAIGNLIDRIRPAHGVVDFLDLGVGDARWPTFNVADMAVSIGAFMLAIVLWAEDRPKTNFQQMRLNWSHAWGTQIACGFHLLAGRYDTALTANDMPYQWMGMAWPSHPVTNPLLGSKGFTLIDDGGEFSRSEKAKLIADWPEAMRRLHVCFGLDQPGTYQNCCARSGASDRSWRFALPGAQGQQHSHATQAMPRSGASGCIWSPGSGAGSSSLGARRRLALVKQAGPRP